MRVETVDRETALAFLREPGVLPTRVVQREDDHALVLVDLGEEPLLGAFLEDSVTRALAQNAGFARRLCGPLSLFEADARFEDAVPLAGVIFHVSRCGSTIPVRVLQASRSTHVVAEADPIDIVVSRLPANDDLRVRMLRNVVAMYARRRNSATERLVLKLDAWHLARIGIFRKAFPEVPFVVVVRDPLDVLLSHRRRRGSHVVPGQYPASYFGITSGEVEPYQLDRYAALVLRCLYRHALTGAKEGATLIDYTSLPASVFDTVLPMFGVSLEANERASTEWLATQHAKIPDQAFDAVAEAAANDAPEAVRSLVDELVRPAYEALVGT